jgi:hypothetical protein
MSKQIKLIVAVPTLDSIHRKFVEILTGLVKNLENNGVDFAVHYEGCTLVYISRDNIARKAIEEGYTEVLWLDAEMVFDKDAYWKLKNVGKDFVTAIYRGRHGTHRPCIFEKLEPPERWDSFDVEPSIKEIKGCGFGCVLTSTDILEKVWNRDGTCFRPTSLLGEDLAFCKRASDLGYSIWANLDAPVGHIGQFTINAIQDEDGSFISRI